MVYRNNAGRLGAGFVSVYLETRWLRQKRGFFMSQNDPVSVCKKISTLKCV